MTRPIPGTSPILANTPLNPTYSAASEDWLAAATHVRTRSAALPERGWPADIPSPVPANSPRLLCELKLRLGPYLDTPQAWLPALNAANGSRRQQRSERRIACVQLVRALIKFCDVSTLRIAVPAQTGWVDFTLPYLAEQAGLSVRRAERALRDLVTARLVKSRPQCEVEIGDEGPRYRGLAAIRYVTTALFEQFGLSKWLRHERTRAHLRAQCRRGLPRCGITSTIRSEQRPRASIPGPLLLQRATTLRRVSIYVSRSTAVHSFSLSARHPPLSQRQISRTTEYRLDRDGTPTRAMVFPKLPAPSA